MRWRTSSSTQQTNLQNSSSTRSIGTSLACILKYRDLKLSAICPNWDSVYSFFACSNPNCRLSISWKREETGALVYSNKLDWTCQNPVDIDRSSSDDLRFDLVCKNPSSISALLNRMTIYYPTLARQTGHLHSPLGIFSNGGLRQ